MADCGKPWPTIRVAVLWALLGLGLTGGFPAAAQEPDAEVETNDVVAAEVLARISEMIQAAESGQPDEYETVPTNGLPRTEDSAEAGTRLAQPDRFSGTNRPQTDDRRSRSRRSSRSKSDQSRSAGPAAGNVAASQRAPANALPATNGGPASLDYSAFRIIADRNIFDPNRFARRPGEPRVHSAPRPVDSLTLVGTMSYERGEFAFFDGSSSDYKKALKLSDVIAGYKVTNIAPNAVTLAAGTNELELRVGMQLRRQENGPWQLASHSGSYAAAPASTSTNAAPATAATGTNAAAGSAEDESDIIKRLIQRREQE